MNLLPGARQARGVVFVLAGLIALAQSSAALAHASLVRSEPADRAVFSSGTGRRGRCARGERSCQLRNPQLLTRPAVFVHGIVVAFWIGALVPLAAVMRAPDRRAVELLRFSRAIPTAIILVIASGSERRQLI